MTIALLVLAVIAVAFVVLSWIALVIGFYTTGTWQGAVAEWKLVLSRPWVWTRNYFLSWHKALVAKQIRDMTVDNLVVIIEPELEKFEQAIERVRKRRASRAAGESWGSAFRKLGDAINDGLGQFVGGFADEIAKLTPEQQAAIKALADSKRITDDLSEECPMCFQKVTVKTPITGEQIPCFIRHDNTDGWFCPGSHQRPIDVESKAADSGNG